MERKVRIYNFIKEFWNLVKSWIEVPSQSDSEGWEQVLSDSEKLKPYYSEDNAEGRFFRKMVVDWMEYLKERSKEGER